MPYPSKRTPEIVEEILHRLACGEPLAAICRSDDKFPHPTAWNQWCREDESLRIACAQARDDGADAIATQALDLADNVEVKGEAIQKAKLQIETRLKLLAKWNPKKYGDRVMHTGDAENPVVVKNTVEAESLLDKLDRITANKGPAIGTTH